MWHGWSRTLRFAAAGVLWAAVLAGGSSSWAAGNGSADAGRLADWVKRSADHRGRPFAVVDKRTARIYVYDGAGALVGQSAALLGSTRGDHTVPGVGARAQTGEVGEDERTTPAGRFDAVPGYNLGGEHVVWADYASAFAIHRVRPGRSQGPRTSRLGTDSPDDNRVSYGCVVVPPQFYDQVVHKVMGSVRSVVYVLPETRGVGEFLAALEQQ
ncbi:MAG: L,D-transpeptidase [Ramlibacter sp.]